MGQADGDVIESVFATSCIAEGTATGGTAVVQRWYSGGTAVVQLRRVGTFIVGAATFVPSKLAAWSCGMILVRVAKRANRVESCGAVKKKDGRFTPEVLGKVVVSYVAVLMLA